jgi:hypothetical protein
VLQLEHAFCHKGGTVMAKKGRKRKVETGVALVPLSMYQDEATCRAVIRYFRRGLRQAYRVLAQIVKAKNS